MALSALGQSAVSNLAETKNRARMTFSPLDRHFDLSSAEV